MISIEEDEQLQAAEEGYLDRCRENERIDERARRREATVYVLEFFAEDGETTITCWQRFEAWAEVDRRLAQWRAAGAVGKVRISVEREPTRH